MRKEKKLRKKFKLSRKQRKFLVITVLILIIIGIVFLINHLLPVKDVTKDNLKVSLSTEKLTGNSIEANITTTTKYDIYYYINLIDEEVENLDSEATEYYEENLNTEEDLNNSVNETNKVSNNTSKNTTNSDSNDVVNNSVNNTVYNSVTNTSNDTTNSSIKNILDKEYTKYTENITIENNAQIYLKFGRFGKLSPNPYIFEVNNIDKQGPEIGEIETTSTDSTITVTVTAIDAKNSDLTYYFKLADDTDFKCTNNKNQYTFTKLTEDETYTIYVKVTDGFGNETEAATDSVASSKVTSAVKKIYYFKVNLAANTVTVYDKDENGKYTEPVKAMICSTGKATPKSGTYKISYRYRWLALFGNVYGQYAVRIHGNILFHSVPYLDTYPNTLEYEEFDKLGTSASAGCIRLMVKDVKWIYDNASTGSYVEFYSDASNPGPLGKPTAPKISSDTKNRDWDPTDPDTRNPWNGGSGNVVKTTTNTTSSTTNTIENTTTNTVENTDNNENNTVSNNTTSNDNTIYWNTSD